MKHQVKIHQGTRTSLLTLLCCLLLLLPSCSPAAAPPALQALPENDDNNSFMHLGHWIEETSDGYFMLCDGLLHYYDKKTGKCVIFSDDGRSGSEIHALRLDNAEHEALFDGATSLYLFNGKLILLTEKDYSKSEYNVIEFDPVSKKRRAIGITRATDGNFILKDGKIYSTYRIIRRTETNRDDHAQHYIDIFTLADGTSRQIQMSDLPEDFRNHNIAFPRLYQDGRNVIFALTYQTTEKVNMEGTELYHDYKRSLHYRLNVDDLSHTIEWMADSKDGHCRGRMILNLMNLNGHKIYNYFEGPEYLGEEDLQKFIPQKSWYSEHNEISGKDLTAERKTLPDNTVLVSNGKTLYSLNTDFYNFFTGQKKPLKLSRLEGEQWEIVAELQAQDEFEQISWQNFAIGQDGRILILTYDRSILELKEGQLKVLVNDPVNPEEFGREAQE